MTVSERILNIKNELPPTVKLVAVSKFKPVEDIMEAYNAGLRDFGENRPQEMAEKTKQLPKDIQWHFIGHLQTNKIKLILSDVYMIHSVDSLKLAREINSQANSRGLVKDCLLQVHIAREETKQGFLIEELKCLMEELLSLKNIRICGLMGMASFVNDVTLIRGEFRNLKEQFDYLKKHYFTSNEFFKEISMGMSGDYKIAIEEGSTIVRIGTGIFGSRLQATK
jgi:pyridoxal phosphate enzyme (YggS family)